MVLRRARAPTSIDQCTSRTPRAESTYVPSTRLSPPMAIRDHDRGGADLCGGHGAESCVLSSRQALFPLCGNGRAEFTSLVFERDGSGAFFELSRLSRLERRGRPLYCGILKCLQAIAPV